MAKPKFVSLTELMDGWITINSSLNPNEHAAWADYRARVFGNSFVPKNYSVPTPFPPSTPAAEQAYAEAMAEVRRQAGVGAAPKASNDERAPYYVEK